MKIFTVVGARPQFIKAAVVSPEIREAHTEVLVHTGQHYDYDMSAQFFEELGIPEPDYNLGISGGSHARMTARMLEGLEGLIIKEKPDWVLLYGDTNSTLAAALAAAKLHCPVCHVEAGARTHSLTNPEEVNRICTDHVSSLLLTSSEESMDGIKREGLAERAVFVGDPMYDAFVKYSNKVPLEGLEMAAFEGGEKIRVSGTYYYLTCHREENTHDDSNLGEILSAMEELDAPAIYPVHPRNRERVHRLMEQNKYGNIIFTSPVGYLESICLVKNARKIVTDSGGVQREAFFSGRQCVTVLDFVSWPETMRGNRNQIAKPMKEDILLKLSKPQSIDKDYRPFGDGHAGVKIVKALEAAHARRMGDV